MKKYIVIICSALLLISSMTMAQMPANRTVSTIVADALAQLPASKQTAYNQVMKDLASTGTEGVTALVSMMNNSGNTDDSKVEYALSGLTSYASNDATLKKSVEQAYLAALENVSERETKAFVVRQLEVVGSDASIDKLSKFLNDNSMSSPATCAIAGIGGEKAGKALMMALMSRIARSPEVTSNIIEALGHDKVKAPEGAEALVKTYITNENVNLRKVALKTLSQIGSKASLADLAAAAAKAGYKMEPTGANEAYIALIKRVCAQGSTKEASAAATKLLKNATKAGAAQTRIAAMETIFATQTDKTKALKAALKDKDKAYRNAALKYASSYADKAMYTEMFKYIAKTKTDEKIDVLNWIGREAQSSEKKEMLKSIEIGVDKTGTQILTQQLNNSNIDVKQAAAWALNKIGSTESISALAGLLTSSDKQTVELGREALSSFNGDVTPTLAKVMSAASDEGKKAALEVLALRKANSYINTVLEQTKSASPEVKTAAYTALKDVVSEKDFVNLCGMLETAEPSTVAPLQQAVISSVSSMSPAEQTETISRRMLQAGDSKKYLYYSVLSATGEKKALATIVKGFSNEKGTAKDAAFEALRNWKGFDAAEPLFNICKNANESSYFDNALESYITLASDVHMTGENRFIYLRKAMDVAKTDEQKNKILKQIGNTGSFIGLMYAGKYLDDNALKENAAQAVMNIALANKDYTGTDVVNLLNKAAAALNNSDADYQRQAINKHLNELPKGAGYVSIFNGKDLTGWKGLVANPIERAKMKAAAMKKAQAKADEAMNRDWKVEDGSLVFEGDGFDNICTEKLYGDFEMYVDWRLDPEGKEPDAGIYLRGTPQVQIWDTSRVNVGAQVGSGGLYNNQVNASKPLKVADNKLGEWNTFYIKMVGDRVTVKLNGELVVDNVILENYWDRSQPIPAIDQIELQAHGSKAYFRDIYVKELKRVEPFQLSAEEKKEGFKVLFDGTNMHEWTGNLAGYTLEDGCISVSGDTKFGGNLYTKNEYSNFVYRFDFKLTHAANNGIGIRTPMEGDAAYMGMEIQVLDSEDPVYKNLHEYQYHGSVYGVIPAKRGYLKPVGEWNTEEIVADGNHIKVTLNGTVILDGDIKEAAKNGTKDGKKHPGLFNKSGHIGFLGHGSHVEFRNIRIKELK